MEQDFVVKAIHAHGPSEDNPPRMMFLIEWEGYPDENDFTWEIEDQMVQCYDIISNYRRENKLPRTKLRPTGGASGEGKFNTDNWVGLDKMEKTIQQYLSYSKYASNLKLMVVHLNDFKIPKQDSILVVLHLNHYYTVLYINKSKRAFITDGNNNIFDPEIEGDFKGKIGSEITKIRMDRQFKIDHCTSAALLGALELVKYYKKGDLAIKDLVIPESWKERITSQLHKKYSNPEQARKDIRQVSRFLTCKFCGNFKTTKGKVALANHERSCSPV